MGPVFLLLKKVLWEIKNEFFNLEIKKIKMTYLDQTGSNQVLPNIAPVSDAHWTLESITHPETYMIGNEERPPKDIIFNIEDKQVKLTDLLKTIAELKKQVNALYYAPGEPGYFEAQQNFTEKLKNQQT